MTNTLQVIKDKFNLDLSKSPVEIRDFDRDSMAELFGELGFKIGVEIGVRDGGYSLKLMQSIPDLALYGVDPYEPHKGYRDHVYQSTFDTFEKEAHAKLDSFGKYEFLKEYSKDAIGHFPNGFLDFVYIDGDHSFYEATFDIEKWSKKVRSGGIISGDDYFNHKGRARIHVYQVVNGYTSAWKIDPWFIVGSKDIVPGEKRDKGRSWFWVV
jgi:predicted O-methyltransferase YrrM